MSLAVVAAGEMILFLLLAPLVEGTKEWIACRIQLRRPAPIWQSWLDLLKLAQIPAGPRPRFASWVFSAAPVIVFGCYLVLALAIPPFGLSVVAPLDLIAIAYLLGFARFMLALAGMDSGTPYGGISASRTMFVNVIAEPILVVLILGLSQPPVASAKATTDVNRLVSACMPSPTATDATLALVITLGIALTVLLVLAIVMLLETGLLPFDNPNSHLEIPMIEKGLQLPYSGRALALLKSADAMRLTFFVLLLTGLLFRGTAPAHLCFMTAALPINLLGAGGVITHLGLATQPLWFALKLLMGVGVLATFEMSRSRIALARLPVPGLVALLLTAAAIAVAFAALWGGF
jgi:formate hydrogenlyase subunit 4